MTKRLISHPTSGATINALHRDLLERLNLGYALQEALLNEEGEPKDYRYLEVNAAFERLLGLRREDVIGRTVLQILPRTEPYWLEIFGSVALTGEAATLVQYGQSFDRYFEITASCPRHGLVAVFFSDVTERQRTEQALRESEERNRELIEQAADGIFVADLKGRYTDVNRAGCRMLGYERDELLGMTIVDLIPPGDVERLWRTQDQLLDGGVHVSEWTLRRKDGTLLPVEVSAKILRDGRWQGIVRDISERKRSEVQLRQAATVFDNTLDAILIADAERHIVAVNKAYTTVTGYEPAEVLGRNPRLQGSGRQGETFYADLWRALADFGQWQGEIWNRRKNGEVYPAWENISVVKDERGQVTNYVSVMSDISHLKQAEEKLSRLALHDALTDLPNRLAFTTNLEHALERAKRRDGKVALLFVDMDHFKEINDTHGHPVGDHLLQVTAERLRGSLRGEDVAARLGGDEFTIIVEEISGPSDATLLAHKVIRVLSEPVELEGRWIASSASVGISIYPDDANTADDLVKAADVALYRAKSHGRHTFEFYNPELRSLTGVTPNGTRSPVRPRPIRDRG